MTTIPTITALPTPVPQTSDPTNFDSRADEFLAALPTMVTEENASITAINTVSGEVSTNASSASTSATTATTKAGQASTSATNAATSETNAATSAANALTSETNAAGYASALAGNINASRTVDLVATANVNKASALANGQTLDGVTITTGMRIFLTAQTAGADNGIYTAPASGAASRSTDADTAAELASGSLIVVTRGTLGKGSIWQHTTDPGFTLGTTSLTFARVAAPRNVVKVTNQSPTGTTSSSLKQMGLGSSLALTPKTGTVRVTLYGQVSSTISANMLTALSYGTGTAPTNGAAITGTTVTPGLAASGSAGFKIPINYSHEITGLTIGTAYWFDINLDTDGGTASMIVGQARVEDVLP